MWFNKPAPISLKSHKAYPQAFQTENRDGAWDWEAQMIAPDGAILDSCRGKEGSHKKAKKASKKWINHVAKKFKR